MNPHDLYGLGATAANALAEHDWHGARRPLLIHPDGNGYIYVLDRRTGEILAAQPFGRINAMTDIDIAQARPRRNMAKLVHADMTTRMSVRPPRVPSPQLRRPSRAKPDCCSFHQIFCAWTCGRIPSASSRAPPLPA